VGSFLQVIKHRSTRLSDIRMLPVILSIHVGYTITGPRYHQFRKLNTIRNQCFVCVVSFCLFFSSSFVDLDVVGWSCFLIEGGNITLLCTQRKLAQLIVRMLTIDRL
jgi:hypothetical protein